MFAIPVDGIGSFLKRHIQMLLKKLSRQIKPIAFLNVPLGLTEEEKWL